MIQKLRGPDAHLVNATFLFEARKTPSAIRVSTVDFGWPTPLTPAAEASDTLYSMIRYGPWEVPTPGGIPNPRNFAELKSAAAILSNSMDTATKLAVLSEFGGLGASRAYANGVHLETVSCDQVLDAIRSGTRSAQCRHFHYCIGELAAAMGFKDAGNHSSLWGRGSFGGDHYVAHYLDPDTGEFLVQNYDTIINTHQKIETEAIDVSTKILSPLTGVSFVESKPGTVHLYQPRTARWIKDILEHRASFEGDRSMLTLELGNHEQKIALEIGNKDVKGFFAHDSFEGSSGTTTVDAIGVSKIYGKSVKPKKYLDEVGYAGSVYAGGLILRAPILSPIDGENGKEDRRMNFFLGGSLVGYARIHEFTGKLTLEANMLDMGFPMDDHSQESDREANINMSIPGHALKAEVEYRSRQAPLRIGMERVMRFTPKNGDDLTPAFQTDYNKLHLTIDTTGLSPKYYIRNETDVYIYGGIEKFNGIGLKDQLQAAISTQKFGDVMLFFEVSDNVWNRVEDPFLKSYLSARLGLDWKRKLTDALSIGAGIHGKTGHNAFFQFENPGEVTPEMSSLEGLSYDANVWVRFVK
ncbi:MAG: hypothetical protein ACXWPM_08690 [Bdellovibrionota bacterium]